MAPVLRTIARLDGTPFPATTRLAARWLKGRLPGRGDSKAVEGVYCAEVVALTYGAMGLLPKQRRPDWYDPGRFWSGDCLTLAEGFQFGEEITVQPRRTRRTRPSRSDFRADGGL